MAMTQTTRASKPLVRAQLELRVLDIPPEIVPHTEAQWLEAFQDWGLNRQPQECSWVVAYDAMSVVASVVEVARGGHLNLDVHLPTLLAVPLVAGCERFRIAHNHPNSYPNPTAADFESTRMVMTAANACGLFFDDHVILTPRGHFWSMEQHGQIKRVPYGSPVNRA